ncbi:MAG: Flp pilus assembly complex ATPase component TadA [Lachnospiraceae bacterium]|nr:Flp pilus assembly complex ATPase component TadA [Lachnospiraceae bacterium]
MKVIRECIFENAGSRQLTGRQRSLMSHELFNRIRRLDMIQDLLEDDRITEIMVNGPEDIFIEKGGRIQKTGLRFDSAERLADIIGKIASDANRTVNMSSPIMDARLPDGSRVNVILPPVALNGPILTIRRFPDHPIDAEKLIMLGSITAGALEFMKALVISGYNILISGSTGCGKTTFLNVLSSFIPEDERIVTIEDSAELRIMGIDNLVRLETRCATTSGCSEITIRDLIRTALRMRPDRIVVGEVRGEEAIDMLQAFNVGQDGSLSTIHANSAGDAISRLETMVMLSTNIPVAALRRQIASGVDIIVHLGRLRDKSRHVLEIKEIIASPEGDLTTKTLYRFSSIKERLVCEGLLENTEKLERAGFSREDYQKEEDIERKQT